MKQNKQPLPFVDEHGLGMLYKRLVEKRGEREGGRNNEMLDKTE